MFVIYDPFVKCENSHDVRNLPAVMMESGTWTPHICSYRIKTGPAASFSTHPFSTVTTVTHQ